MSSDSKLTQKYDAIVIGAGMSGIACALRLNYLGLKVALLEKHTVLGGLNSYYQRVKKNKEGLREGIRKFDVGLHALTNFAVKGARKKPLTKILRQLKISYDDLLLQEQNFSYSWLGQHKLKFSNDIELLKKEVQEKFPQHYAEFLSLIEFVEKHEDLSVSDKEFNSAVNFLENKISSPELRRLILFPILCYGSAWENDIDLDQFSILFRALYLEGFSRPLNGIRTFFDILKSKLSDSSIDLKFKTQVEKINSDEEGVSLKTTQGELKAKHVFSSMGIPETKKCLDIVVSDDEVGKLTFVEVQLFFSQKVDSKDYPTVLFYSKNNDFRYENPMKSFDESSAIICFPNTYKKYEGDEGLVRLTFMADYQVWKKFSSDEYTAEKKKIETHAESLVRELFPSLKDEVIYKDTFTPLTITKFTSHINGTVYGSPDKKRSGDIGISKLSIIGTDQGFLGVTGSILSGISMANKFVMENVLE